MAMDDKPSGNILQMLADLITDELIFITLEMPLLQVISSHFLPVNPLLPENMRARDHVANEA